MIEAISTGTAACAIWAIAAAATACVIIRPFDVPEAIWAVAGAVLLVATGLLPVSAAAAGAAKGADVYLFLAGMMLLAETARAEGLFDWLAAVAVRQANGSPKRLFLLIYAVGTAVTVFLSNDATTVVLTPAVAAAMRTAKVDNPLPYLFICAFIANAASFVLPISNPANLVIYHNDMPPLPIWLARYALPSLLSIVATFIVLRLTQNEALGQTVERGVPVPRLTGGGGMAAAGIAATALVLIGSSFAGIQLGLPAAMAGAVTALIVLAVQRKSPWPVIGGVNWGVLPLVAGLFALVGALDKTGLIKSIAGVLQDETQPSVSEAAWSAGAALAFAGNLINNLPAGLIAGSAVQAAHVPETVKSTILIGVDLGPNLSVTGSLATILWLAALRREGQTVSAAAFLRLGLLVMPPAFLLALAAATFLRF